MGSNTKKRALTRQKAHRRILVHRKTEEFQSLIALVRQAHARLVPKLLETAKTER